MTLKYHIKTYGCQMNYSDSERVCAVLESAGFRPSKTDAGADLIVFNTCSIRQKAEDRVLGMIPRMRDLKERKHRLLVAVTGCMVRKSSTKNSETKDKLISKIPQIDLVFRIEELGKLPLLIKEAEPTLPISCNSEINEGTLENYFKIAPKYASKFQAYVPIMTGCDKFCAYCVVPYTRGREKSRTIEEIYDECEKLVKNGCVEITLLGQNVNSYGLSATNRKSLFAELLRRIDTLKSEGLRRVRWTSPHPRDMTDDVIEAVATLKTQMPYIHLPVQAGNDKVLQKMNRPYTIAQYKKIIKKIRELIPDCAISTDIIVGFCGETKKQFEDTYRLFEEIRWDMAYLSQYSMRPFSLAYRTMKDDVSPSEKARRWHKLNKLLTKISLEKHKDFIGKEVEILVENCKNGLCEGRSEHFKFTQFKSPKNLVGKLVKVKITGAKEWNLIGKKTI